jgi:hypothetical protein
MKSEFSISTPAQAFAVKKRKPSVYIQRELDNYDMLEGQYTNKNIIFENLDRDDSPLTERQTDSTRGLLPLNKK